MYKKEIHWKLKNWSKETFKIFFFEYLFSFYICKFNVCKFNKCFDSHEILFCILIWNVYNYNFFLNIKCPNHASKFMPHWTYLQNSTYNISFIPKPQTKSSLTLVHTHDSCIRLMIEWFYTFYHHTTFMSPNEPQQNPTSCPTQSTTKKVVDQRSSLGAKISLHLRELP